MNINIDNIPLLSDGYKIFHYAMYPENTEYVYSYFESRGGAKFNKTVFFGLQYLIKKHLLSPITQEDIEEGELFTANYLGDKDYFNREMWEYILKEHEGRMPIEIRAVPEGTPVDVSNVLMTVENTDPKCAALTNHFETVLSHVWSSSTIASLARETRILFDYYTNLTSENPDHVNFQLHDFGFRGASSVESAGIGGAGQLLSFLGTDTLIAMQYARAYYNAPIENLAFSVPASEHSVATALGEAGEQKVFKKMLDDNPTGILSVVIDSYDYRRFIYKYAKEFKDQSLARDGKTVFRPDSGDPNSVTLDVLEELEKVFGSTKNSKGYKCLNPKVGCLFGDGLNYDSIRGILFTMRNNGWASDNIVFGMGGGLLQKVDRDVQRFAFKSSAQKRDGIWYDIQKKPVDSSKVSKKGRLSLDLIDGKFVTVPEGTARNEQLIPVYRNGELLVDQDFADIRARAKL